MKVPKKKLYKLLPFMLLAIALVACESKSHKVKATETIATDTVAHKSPADSENDTKEDENTPQDAAVNYPKTGNKAVDFLPSTDIYEIQYEAIGDLNTDGLNDIAMVIKEKGSKTEDRPMLILLQNKDKTYRLDKVSNVVLPQEYTTDEDKIYEKEEVNIEKGKLTIALYGAGPINNSFSDFKYSGTELLLTSIHTHKVGAGSWQDLYYNLNNGELKEVVTDTGKDSMPTKEQKVKLAKEHYTFESASPVDIIEEVTDKLPENNW